MNFGSVPSTICTQAIFYLKFILESRRELWKYEHVLFFFDNKKYLYS